MSLKTQLLTGFLVPHFCVFCDSGRGLFCFGTGNTFFDKPARKLSFPFRFPFLWGLRLLEILGRALFSLALLGFIFLLLEMRLYSPSVIPLSLSLNFLLK